MGGAEVLYQTINRADMYDGPVGLPRFDFSLSSPDISMGVDLVMLDILFFHVFSYILWIYFIRHLPQ